MITCVDSNGNIFYARQLLGPTVLNTATGEFVGEAGQWQITDAHGAINVVSDEVFTEFFTIKDIE